MSSHSLAERFHRSCYLVIWPQRIRYADCLTTRLYKEHFLKPYVQTTTFKLAAKSITIKPKLFINAIIFSRNEKIFWRWGWSSEFKYKYSAQKITQARKKFSTWVFFVEWNGYKNGLHLINYSYTTDLLWKICTCWVMFNFFRNDSRTKR